MNGYDLQSWKYLLSDSTEVCQHLLYICFKIAYTVPDTALEEEKYVTEITSYSARELHIILATNYKQVWGA